jgi:hypothetical protein
MTVACIIDVFGLGGPPWFGWWDADIAIVQPFTVQIAEPRPGGAAVRGGLRGGDRIDLREQSVASRLAALFQPSAAFPTALTIHRGATTKTVAVTGSTSFDSAAPWKLPPMLSWIAANVWFALCALVIALRRWQSSEARTLALVLLFATAGGLQPLYVVVPSGAFGLVLLLLSRTMLALTGVLLVQLASRCGERRRWRDVVSGVAYATIAVDYVADLLQVFGIATLQIDPLPFVLRNSVPRGLLALLSAALVAATAAAAVATTAKQDKARRGWMLLPLPLANFVATAFSVAAALVLSWFANVTLIGIAEVAWLLGALIVTYAVLNRRVLDSDFVLSRTLVVAAVSLIVVAAFILLDWILGDVLVGVSHATGLIANGALALALGLSLNVIQKRITAFLDSVLFRKRHEDERALLEFSREATYATEAGALMDRTIEKLEQHTDARGAALLLDDGSSYKAARTFGNGVSTDVDENDPAILALKTWHKPLDPHRYGTTVHGALALPMLARGRLRGLVLLGERAGGEAYAPDEVDALSQFALGIGAALEGLQLERDGSLASLQASIATMAVAINDLRASLTNGGGRAPETP